MHNLKHIPDVEHLRSEVYEFKEQERRLLNLIDKLERQLALMTVSDLAINSMKINEDLKYNRADLEEIRAKIRENERLIVYKILIMLDYKEQIKFFQNCYTKNHVGAFTLHGSAKSTSEYRGKSIGALLTRLLHATPNSSATPLMLYGLPFRGQRTDISAIWRHLAADVGLGSGTQQDKIIEEVCKILESRSVILVFHWRDGVSTELLNFLIQKFWEPLATVALETMEHVHLAERSRLLMFLVDSTGYMQNWDIHSMEEFNRETWRPHLPIKLSIVTPLTEQQLGDWLGQWSEYLVDILPDHLKQLPFASGARHIWDNSDQGDPDYVMWYFCEQCKVFIEGINKWLIL